jgi:hypothetical protein
MIDWTVVFRLAVFSYLVCAGLCWARVLQVEYKKARGTWHYGTPWHKRMDRIMGTDMGYVAMCVFLPMIPVFNIAMAIMVLSALWEEGQHDPYEDTR